MKTKNKQLYFKKNNHVWKVDTRLIFTIFDISYTDNKGEAIKVAN